MLPRNGIKLFSLLAALCTLVWINRAEAKVETRVSFTGSERITTRQENVAVDNCDSRETSTKKMSVSLTIGEALEVRGGEKMSVGGTIPIYGINLNVGAEVSNEVKRSYGTDITHTREIELRTPPYTTRTHIVEHRQKWRDGIIEVKSTTLGVTTSRQRIPFTTCIFYDLIQAGYRDAHCPRPYLVVTSMGLYPSKQFGAGCRQGFKYFDLHVGIKNEGNKRSTKFDVSASWRYPGGTMTASIVQSGYIEAGATFIYQGLVSLNCKMFPKGYRLKPDIHIVLRDEVLRYPETHNFQGTEFILPY